MSDTYSSVDDAADVQEALAWQDRINVWPQIRAYKCRSYELVAGHRPILDAGAGTGHDLDAIGGAVVGADLSRSMCQRARDRGGIVCRADAVHLPFGDDVFGGARADRVVQHVADPIQAIGEMKRVVRPGGRIVVCDPDQESLVISVPGVPSALLDEVKRLRRDKGYRNGALAARLPAIFDDLDLDDITIDAFPLLLRDPDEAFGLPDWVRYWGHAHRPTRDHAGGETDRGFAEDDIAAWDRGIERSRAAGTFVYAVTYFVVSGCRT